MLLYLNIFGKTMIHQEKSQIDKIIKIISLFIEPIVLLLFFYLLIVDLVNFVFIENCKINYFFCEFYFSKFLYFTLCCYQIYNVYFNYSKVTPFIIIVLFSIFQIFMVKKIVQNEKLKLVYILQNFAIIFITNLRSMKMISNIIKETNDIYNEMELGISEKKK